MNSFKSLKSKIEARPTRLLSSFLPAFSLKLMLPYITCFCLIQASQAQGQEDLSKLREQFARATNNAVDPITLKYIQQLELLKNRYTNEEAIHIENEILKIKQIRESGFAQIAIGQVVATDPIGASGKSLKDLLGIWFAPAETGYKSTTTYEFKAPNKMILTRIEMTNGGKRETLTNYSVRQLDDKIMIELQGESSSGYRPGYSSGYGSNYEITIPFSSDKPEIVSVSGQTNSFTRTTIYLERKPK